MTGISSAPKVGKTTLVAGLVEAMITPAPVVVVEYVTAVATACQVPRDLALLTILGNTATVVALALDTGNDVPVVLFRDSRKSNELHAHGPR